MFTSSFLLDEFKAVMRLKFPKLEAAVSDTVLELSLLCECVTTSGLPKIAAVKEDPDDNRVLECAVAAHAECIVSGDKHLLKLGEYRGISILSPSGFLGRYRL